MTPSSRLLDRLCGAFILLSWTSWCSIGTHTPWDQVRRGGDLLRVLDRPRRQLRFWRFDQGRRVPVRLPDREEPLDRQRLRLRADLRVLRGAGTVPVPGLSSGASSVRWSCGRSSSSPASLLDRFDWILYVFGAFLLFTAVKMAAARRPRSRPRHNLRPADRPPPGADDRRLLDGQKFFTRRRQVVGDAPLRSCSW